MTSGVYKRTLENNNGKYERTPELRAAIAKIHEESGANERMRGGNDIVNHHYIYDHNDLSKYTIKMTRSKHSQLHGWMRGSGIKVPHINMD